MRVKADKAKASRLFEIVLVLLAAVSAAVFLELILNARTLRESGTFVGLRANVIDAHVLRHLAVFAGLFAFVVTIASLRDGVILRFAVRHRWGLSLAIFVAAVVCKISGSSIACWSEPLGEQAFQGTLFGIPRSIRMDEWTVFTPFAFSQSISGAQALSPLIRGGTTDVSVVYAQPCWAPATVFRPFLWGYLPLGPERGLSFFWIARVLVLALVTFEFGRLVTGGNDILSAALATLVTFAPIVQWWFAVNGTAELMIFGQGLVLALHHLLYAHSSRTRLAFASLLAWLLGCYALILYPAWQIPFAYVFAAMGVWDVAVFLREGDDYRGHVISAAKALVVPVLVLVVLLAIVIASSWSTIQAVMNSAYPGTVEHAGGNMLGQFTRNFLSLLGATDEWAYESGNVCEEATFFCLFPFGPLLGLCQVVRKRDGLLAALFVPYSLFLVYGVLGLPPLLARLTLLSRVQDFRLAMAMGYAEAIFLVRSLAFSRASECSSLADSNVVSERVARLALSGIVAVLYAAYARHLNSELMHRWNCFFLFVVVLMMTFALVSSFYKAGAHDMLLSFALGSMLVACAGFCINPVQRGASALLGSDFVTETTSVVHSDADALWIADDNYLAQAAIVGGAPTINTIHTYPNLDFWYRLDPSHSEEETYNRYAHIIITLADETAFTLLRADTFMVSITTKDLRNLGARYWASYSDLTEFSDSYVTFTRVAQTERAGIYEMTFTGQS